MQTSVVEKQITFASIAISDLGQTAAHEIAKAVRRLLADTFALYTKTKNFHWHMTGRQFRDYHLLLDERRRQRLQFIQFLRIAHELCDRHRDVATARLIENWIDQAELGWWFLAEVGAGAA